MKAADGISSRQIRRTPLAIVALRSSYSRRAAKRARVGNTTVAIATLKIPWGSM
jgi:hypothetical protein